MKAAVIGSGGREHAIGWKLAQELGEEKVVLLPGNGGWNNRYIVDIEDKAAIARFLQREEIGLVVIGPEAPLASGIVDYLAVKGIKVFGPCQRAAQLESSKVWAKDFMHRYGVATARHRVCSTEEECRNAILEFDGNVAVKVDGLAAGKGVIVCHTVEEAEAATQNLRQMYDEEAPLVIEERLSGPEVSLLGFTDGKTVNFLLPSQDYKRVGEGDTGPNTGGMGAICPVPLWAQQLSDAVEEQIVRPTLIGLAAEGIHYRGVLYFGIMLTDDGPKLLEYNIRLGDPEAQVTLPMLKSPLTQVINACMDGSLKDVELEFYDGACAGVVVASGGYPSAYETGKPITGLDTLDATTMAFHAGTEDTSGQLVTTGGRVATIVCRGCDLAEALEKCNREAAKVSFEGAFFRSDIGSNSVVPL